MDQGRFPVTLFLFLRGARRSSTVEQKLLSKFQLRSKEKIHKEPWILTSVKNNICFFSEVLPWETRTSSTLYYYKLQYTKRLTRLGFFVFFSSKLRPGSSPA